MASPPASISARSLAAVPGHLDLEVAHAGNLAREPHQERHGQRDPRQRRVLDHDAAGRLASATCAKCASMPASSARSPAPWYGGISISIAAPACAAACARSPAMRVLKWLQVTITGTRPATCARQSVEQRAALRVGQQELLGVVGEDADAVHALVDHAVEHAPHARQVEVARRRERRGRDGMTPVRGCKVSSRVWTRL